MGKQLTIDFVYDAFDNSKIEKQIKKVEKNKKARVKKDPVPKIVATINKRIDSAQKKADNISIEISGNYTHKRAREAAHRASTKEKLEKMIGCLLTLTHEWQTDLIPEELKQIRSVQDIETVLYSGFPKPPTQEDIDRGGWYAEEYPAKKKKADRLGITSKEVAEKMRELIKDRMVVNVSPEEMKERELKKAIDDVRAMKIPGFFPTPKELIHKMFDYARMNRDDAEYFLEPSAGIGSICDEIKSERPDAQIVCCEINPDLEKILEMKGYTVESADIFSLAALQSFDRIIMNPPFERGQDMEHIRHCFNNHLEEGGILVSVASTGVMNRSGKKDKEFQEFVNDKGYFVKLDGGEFKGAFNSTGVSTCLVVLEK